MTGLNFVHCTRDNITNLKLSASPNNDKYQLGGVGNIITGTPEINYQSVLFIKSTKTIWTHGTFYEGSSNIELNDSIYIVDFSEVNVEGEIEVNTSWIKEICRNYYNGKLCRVLTSDGLVPIRIHYDNKTKVSTINTIQSIDSYYKGKRIEFSGTWNELTEGVIINVLVGNTKEYNLTGNTIDESSINNLFI